MVLGVILASSLLMAGCRKDSHDDNSGGKSSAVREPIKNMEIVDGELAAEASRIHEFERVQADDVIRIDVADGRLLLKKYREEPKVAIWVEDADSGRKIVGTLFNAYNIVGETQDLLRVRVKNETRDNISYSLTLTRLRVKTEP